MPARPSVLLGLLVGLLLAFGALVIALASERARAEPQKSAEPSSARADPPALPLSAASRRSAGTPADEMPTAALGPADAASPGPRTLVQGTLLDSSDAPVPGDSSARISFVDRAGRRRNADARESGAYEFADLEFGSYWVSASARGYRTTEERVELGPNRARMRRDFTLQKAVELRIRVVTPQGQDLLEVLKQRGAPPGARWLVPIVTHEAPGPRLDEGTGNPNEDLELGHFRQDNGLGLLTLDCDPPVFVSLVQHQVVLQTQRVAGAEVELTFVLALDALLANLASIRVQVVDAETHQPIPNARVLPWNGNFSNENVATDPQGSATLAAREPGTLELQIRARGYEIFRARVDARPGLLTDLGTLALEKQVTLEGHVLDSEGLPRSASFALGILDPTDHSIRWLPREDFASRANGAFEIRGLGRREYVIRTSGQDALERGDWRGAAWVSGNVLVDARGGTLPDLEVRVRPASRLVLDASCARAGVKRFRVIDDRGLVSSEECLRGSAPRPLDLLAGSYRVLLFGSRGTLLLERLVTLGPELVELGLPR